MRQVFSSPRLENVERVAAMLEEAGIETRITHGRSYKGARRGDFSYRDHSRTEPVPAVWIVNSEDQIRGREILRAAGLLETTRAPSDSFLPTSVHVRDDDTAPDPGKRRAFRIKLGLLVVIAVVIALVFMARKPAVVPPAATPSATSVPAAASASAAAAPIPPPRPPAPLKPGASRIPDDLAKAMLVGELPTQPGHPVCLEIDGGDPSPALLAALPAPAGAVLPVSQCAARADALPLLAIGDYHRRESGSGTVALERRLRGATVVSLRYDVRPEGDGWRVIVPYH